MITREQKIDAIYEKIADKTLNFGCNIIIDWKNATLVGKNSVLAYKNDTWNWIFEIYFQSIEDKNYKIIWHPVMIGDVLHYLCHEWSHPNATITQNNIDNVYYNWNDSAYNKPIDNQSNACIDLVYSLI
jgi:hypothetical protein